MTGRLCRLSLVVSPLREFEAFPQGRERLDLSRAEQCTTLLGSAIEAPQSTSALASPRVELLLPLRSSFPDRHYGPEACRLRTLKG